MIEYICRVFGYMLSDFEDVCEIWGDRLF